MEKENYRKYLENIAEYLNVWSICSLYNEKNPSEKIDYTNLKNFINKRRYEKISIKRLENLTFFIKQNVGMNLILENNNEQHLIEKSKKEKEVKAKAIFNEEKVKTFMEIFKGRTDLYAKRWTNNKTGKSGYSPVCMN